MTDQTTTPPPAAPTDPPYTTEDVRLAEAQEDQAEATMLADFLRSRARTLNLECRIRDQRIADLEAQVAALEAHLDAGLAEDAEGPERDTDAWKAGNPALECPDGGE